jgi:hypothetical protein
MELTLSAMIRQDIILLKRLINRVVLLPLEIDENSLLCLSYKLALPDYLHSFSWHRFLPMSYLFQKEI